MKIRGQTDNIGKYGDQVYESTNTANKKTQAKVNKGERIKILTRESAKGNSHFMISCHPAGNLLGKIPEQKCKQKGASKPNDINPIEVPQ